MTLTDPVVYELPPSATFAVRECMFTPDGRPGGFTGFLAVRTARTPGGRAAVRRYVVDEDTTEPSPGRRWLVLSASGADSPVYRVSYGPGGWACDCTGSRCRHQDCDCVHKAAFAALLAAGELG